MAQSSDKVRFGFHGGATLSNIHWTTDQTFVDLPENAYRPHFGMGVSMDVPLSSRFYVPVNLDYKIRQFAVGTGGTVLIENAQGQFILVQEDFIDYRVRHACLTAGIGYKIIPALRLELGLYNTYPLSNMQERVGDFIAWRRTSTSSAQQDRGLTGAIRFQWLKWYLRGTYLHGLSNNNGFLFTDANGNPSIFAQARNRNYFLSLGYQF